MYKHGIYIEHASTVGALQARAVGTVPVYIGTAPITTDDETKINTPILINSYNDFISELGYSEDWGNYTLCEAAYAHFKNNVQAIAPFIVINIYRPSKHKGTDGKADLSKITKEEFKKGLDAIDLAMIKCGVSPNIIVAPEFEAYADEIIDKCTVKINGKWGCVAYLDVPTSEADTIEEAILWKSEQAINSKYARLHFPKAKYNKFVFHLSVLDAVTSQIVDTETDGVSCRSSSNKRIICDVPVIDASKDLFFSESEANKLNEKGITTVNYIGGSFRLWGGHMANYDYSSIASIEAKDRSDATVRMQIYLDNWLNRNHIINIDAPITRRDIDNIISNVNIGLNSFVNSGYLLKGECYYSGGNNATEDLADGNLVLDILHTEVPNGKSISFKLAYDVSGLDTLYETEEV